MIIIKRFLHIKTVPKSYGNQLSKFKYSKQIPTHEVLTKLGYITYPRAGLVNWSKMGLLIQNKISQIIRQRMDEIQFEEVSLSLISHKELWKLTNRWDQEEIFKLVGDEYLLVPTAEEEITNYVKKQFLESYKNFPLALYQINPKFRNEKRPRGGLLRGKEFLMKDAYSFDLNESEAMKTYEKVVGAYHKIFQDLGIPYVKAEADSGDIGGSLSHEWHYLNSSGEDTVFECNECHNVSNMEKALSYPKEIDETIEVSVKYFTTEDKSTLICAYYPSNRVLEPKFIQNEIPDIDLDSINDLSEFNHDISTRIVRIMDSRLSSRSKFPDFPISNFINRSLITTLTDIPIVLAQEGEICGHCEEGKLSASSAIEVGHTFYLGDKYSKPLDLEVDVPTLNNSIEKQRIMMGCYGIGISRIIAAIAEINRDEKGLKWPRSIAPWEVTVVEVSKQKQLKNVNDNNHHNNPQDNFQEIYNILNQANVDYRLDNRSDSMGKKLKQSDLLGIPLSIILGNQYPIIEIEVRGNKKNNNNNSWLQSYTENKGQFDWKVETDAQGNDTKHYIHKDGLVTVVNSLLNDM